MKILSYEPSSITYSVPEFIESTSTPVIEFRQTNSIQPKSYYDTFKEALLESITIIKKERQKIRKDFPEFYK